jgi:hypothetical protein
MAGTILVPLIFIALGAPFIALGVRSGDGQLVYSSSSSTGKLEVAIFGACFAIAGLAWGVIAARKVLPRLRSSGLLASVAGVGVAFLIATGVSSAIGSSPATPLKRSAPSTATVAQSRPATIQTSRAVAQASAQAKTATKLAVCVTVAGSRTDRIPACERRYIP